MTPGGTRAVPSVDALPQPVTRTPIDLEALARGYASQVDAMQAAWSRAGKRRAGPVRLRQPVDARPTLQRLIDQAARARASVILRGLVKGSLRETVARCSR
jgi:conjugal transfer pilus assembly protein TrbC